MQVTINGSTESIQISGNNFKFVLTSNPWRPDPCLVSSSKDDADNATEIQATVNMVASRAVEGQQNQHPAAMRKITISQAEGSFSFNQSLLHISSLPYGRNVSEPRSTPGHGVDSAVGVTTAQTIQQTDLVANRALKKRKIRPTQTIKPIISKQKPQNARWKNNVRSGDRWLEQEVLLLKMMKARGSSSEDIAETLLSEVGISRTPYAVTRKWFRVQKLMRESRINDQPDINDNDAAIVLTQLQKSAFY